MPCLRLLLVAAAALAGAAAPSWCEPPAVPPADEELQQRLARAELLAGLTRVEGPGVVVLLRNSPRPAPPGVDRKTLMVQEHDVNAVLNALRAAGAEALAIGGSASSQPERVLAGTAARQTRGGLAVNGMNLLQPYRVHAIGDPRSLLAELMREDGVVKKAGLDTLQMVEVQEAPLVLIPAAREIGEFRFARRPGEERPAPVEERPAPAPRPAPGIQAVIRRDAPAPVRPPAPETMAEPAIPVPAPAGGGALFGGRGLARFHTAGCRYGERIERSQRIAFSTIQEARGQGRLACSVCRPEQAGR